MVENPISLVIDLRRMDSSYGCDVLSGFRSSSLLLAQDLLRFCMARD